MLRKGHVLAIVLITVSAVTFFSIFETAYGELNVEKKSYEILYSGTINVKLFGTLEYAQTRGNKVIFTITDPEGNKEEQTIFPSKDGYFENYLMFDRNSFLGIYDVTAYDHDGDYVGFVSFELYGKGKSVAITKQTEASSAKQPIPSWIKEVAGFWCEDLIDDASFIEGIQYLIDNDIIAVTATSSDSRGSQNIPSWINNNACWWSQGLIADEDFAAGLEFLISTGIIQIEKENTELYDDSSNDYAFPGRSIADITDYEPTPSPESTSSKQQPPVSDVEQYCYGSADCFAGYVTRIIDGDTIEVDGKSIRFALVNTPEYGEYGFDQATNYIKTICPVGSAVVVDEDDRQTQGSYGRIIARILCAGVPSSLNEAVLGVGLAEISTSFCSKSEFASLSWAQTYGCEPKTSQYTPPQTITPSPSYEPAPKTVSCDPSYPDFCIPPSPPDLDCIDISANDFTVFYPDPHNFDGDFDGIGCETYSSSSQSSSDSSEPTPSCDPSYPDFCIPPSPPDLDCADIPTKNFTVLYPDPHNFDGDGDGIGCESSSQPTTQPSCDPSYPDVCIPPYPPDLDCGEITYKNFRVVGSDPHRFDGDGDGIGCEG